MNLLSRLPWLRAFVILALFLQQSHALDWPMWRNTPGHTAVSEEKLADALHLQWILTFSKRERVWDDPLNHDLMQYDKIFEPIVLGRTIFFNFSSEDKVAAFDIETGEQRWAFYADGPVRFAPAGWRDRVYICSDDGYLYCLAATDGSLLWKFRGAPGDGKALGNRRLISAWPARGGPVIRDGIVYFAASIWPFMGTFIYALDANTGEVEWVNDSTGADYVRQPHNAPAFAGVAPQGILVALKDHLLLPGGRSVPAALDRKTGELVHFKLNDGGKANGGSFVVGAGNHFFVHTRLRGVRAYETKTGKKMDFLVNEPVLARDFLYSAAGQPHLKTRLDIAQKAMEDAEAAWTKAKKKLEAAIASKERPLRGLRKALNETKTERESRRKTLDEIKIQVEPKDPSVVEAERNLAQANERVEAAQKKFDEAKKKKKQPIDKKLYEEAEKKETKYDEKERAFLKIKSEWDARGRDVPVVQAHGARGERELAWEFQADGTGDLIMSGGKLYAAGPEEIVAIDLPGDPERSRITWRHPVDGQVLRLLAANGKLFAVTLDGRIFCFGSRKKANPRVPPRRRAVGKQWPFSQTEDNGLARQVLALAGAEEGYAMCYGVGDGRLLEALTEESRLHLVAVEPDKATVDGLRVKFDDMGLYGKRIALAQGDPRSYRAPPYIFNLIVLGQEMTRRLHDPSTLRRIYNSVRPYGGALWFPKNPTLEGAFEKLALPGADIVPGPAGSTFVFRRGPLPGAADWTHQYGDLANTVKSDDKRVKLPLGILWFGGSPNSDVLPRHGHGPSEQVIGGRVIIEGMNRLSARDVYTGRVLWARDFEDLGTYGAYYDDTYKDEPLNAATNQAHIPGAGGRGTNYVATEDSIYVAIGSACRVLDAATGRELRTIKMPVAPQAPTPPAWAFIGVEGDLLLAGNDFARYTSRYRLDEKEQKKKGKKGKHGQRRDRKRKKKEIDVPPIEDLSASQGLIAFNRHTGRPLWSVDAEFSFLHNGIVAGGGKIFLLDKFPKSKEGKLKRRGLAKPEHYRILAIDATNGEPVWEKREDVFGTWLSYSAEHDILLQAGAKARDRLKDEVGKGLITYRGATGEVIWKKEKLAYAGPCMLHHDLILTSPEQYADSAGAFRLTDGSPYLVKNPITGKREPWRIRRAYGCSTPIAGEHLLTFRSGAAGYYDLDDMSGTGNFGGFRSGCTSNLIPANGVLNAPDYTRTCSCGYQNQTSLALVHMPEVELWTFNRFGADSSGPEEVRRVGINFGAPGDRRAPDGTLWLESPSVGGTSPAVTVTVDPPKDEKLVYFRRHSSGVTSADHLKWVAASGIRNAKKITITPRVQFQARDGNDRLVFRIASGGDDAEESAKGQVDLASSDLELIREEESDQLVGLRFPGVQLFQGEEISNVYIQFTVDEPDEKQADDEKQNGTRLFIHTESIADAPPLSPNPRNLSSRFLSRKSIAWTPKAWNKEGDRDGDQRTPNLAPLLRSLIHRNNWRYGNAIAFFIKGQGKRVAHAFDGDPKKAPRLIIELKDPRTRARIAAKEDDAEEHADGSISLGSSDLEFTTDSAPKKPNPQIIGLRFRDVPIPRGQRLAAAFIQFHVKEPSRLRTKLTIQMEAQPNPPPYKEEKTHISSRRVTQASIPWTPDPWMTKNVGGKAQRTPNLASLIQPLIASKDWKPGNAIAFRISGTGDRSALSFDSEKHRAPSLVLQYAPTVPTRPVKPPRFTVRLHFFDPDRLPLGQRPFHVLLQGRPVLRAFDMAAQRRDGEEVIVKEFTNVPIPRHLAIELRRLPGTNETPVLSGVELIRESRPITSSRSSRPGH